MDSRLSGWRKYVGLALLVAASNFFLYFNTLSAQFVYDDTRAVVSNADLRPSSPWSVLVSNDFWGTPLKHSGSHKSFRPVCTTTFRLNYLFGELDPFGYHLVNVLLHVVSSLLFLCVCVHVFGGKTGCVLIATMLFSVHPIHCEAVAGIVGRADVLACIFFLLAFLFHLRAAGCPFLPSPFSPHRTMAYNNSTGMTVLPMLGWMLCVTLCTALSMFSKESGITILGVLVLYDIFILTLPSLTASAVKGLIFNSKYCLFRLRMVCLTVSGYLLLLLRFQAMGHSPPSFSPSDNPAASEDSWLTRTLTFLYLPALNMWLLLYPRTLSFDWSMDAVPLVRGISDSRNVMTIALYASLGVLSFYILRSIKTRKSQPISFGSTFSNSFTSMPSSPALQHNTNMSNRNVYPPPGMSLKMRYPFHQISHETGSVPSLKPVQITHFSRRASATARIMLVGLAFLVVPFVPASNLLFHVGFVVAERVLYIPSLGFCILVAHGVSVLYEKCSSDVFRKILIVLCTVTLALLSWRTYLRNQDWHDEESFYRSGIGTNSAKAWGNLGNTLTNNGRHEEAEIAYQNAIKHRPNMADAHYNYGTLLLNMGRYEDASKRFQDAITYRPKLAAAYLNLGIVLTNINRKKEAEKVYRDCSVISDEGLKNPKGHMSSVTSCLFNLGKVLLEDSNAKDAVRTLLKAVEVAPYGYGLQGVYNLLGEAYSTIGEYKMAVKFFRRSLESRPGHLPAVIGFAKLLQGQGHFSEALAILGEGKRHHPERTEIYVQEGIVRLSNKEVSQAKESFDKAIVVSPLEDVDVVISAAHSFREHGNMADAERYYRLAVERQPNSSKAHSNLGAYLHLDHKYAEAENHYLKALELNPKDQLTKDNLKKMRAASKRTK